MQAYEYKVCPAPNKGQKAPGVKGPEARFAHGVESVLNAQAAEGWEYIRADILPSEERQGLTSTQTVYRTLLVFRRARQPEASGAAQEGAVPAMAAASSGVATPEPAQTDAAASPGAADPSEPTPDAAASLRREGADQVAPASSPSSSGVSLFSSSPDRSSDRTPDRAPDRDPDRPKDG